MNVRKISVLMVVLVKSLLEITCVFALWGLLDFPATQVEILHYVLLSIFLIGNSTLPTAVTTPPVTTTNNVVIIVGATLGAFALLIFVFLLSAIFCAYIIKKRTGGKNRKDLRYNKDNMHDTDIQLNDYIPSEVCIQNKNI